MTLDVQHGLDCERAKAAARLAAEHYEQRFADRGLRVRWASDTHADVELATHGVHVHGSVDISPTTLQIVAEVPFVLKAFKSKAVAAIERETRHWADRVRVQPAASRA